MSLVKLEMKVCVTRPSMEGANENKLMQMKKKKEKLYDFPGLKHYMSNGIMIAKSIRKKNLQTITVLAYDFQDCCFRKTN